MKRVLIVNADDFGISRGVNDGVARAHERGIVTSASLMVDMPGVRAAVRAAQGQPRLGLGLHVNFTAPWLLTQACINMMVNVHLMPAKGMTLPFISYGGSSLLSLALGMGFLIALTRRRPRAEMMDSLNQDWPRG